MIHNKEVSSWYEKLEKLENSATESIRKAYLPKSSYTSDGKTVYVDYTPDERKAVYAEIAKGFYQLQKEGDLLLADLQKQEQSPEVTDDIKAISGKLASFLTNTRLYDYSEGKDAENKFEKIRAEYLKIYNQKKYLSSKAKFQEMTKKSGIVYTDPQEKAKLKRKRDFTQSSFNDMNYYAKIAEIKNQND